MNRFVSCLAGIIAWGLMMFAPLSAMGDLGKSNVLVSGESACYVAGETNHFCFLITHDPSADEEILAVDFYFPEGWTGFYTCDDNPDHPQGLFALRLDARDVRP